jgi:TatD DNase family protein
MIDAHIHLHDISPEKRVALVSYLCDQRTFALFCNAASPKDWTTVLSMADLFEMIKPFIGIHPWFVDSLDHDWEAKLVQTLRHGQCGVGEIGLDKTPKGGNFERQKSIFVRQLDIAIMSMRPVVLHCVDAWGPMMAILRTYSFNGVPFIVHSFIGSKEILAELLQMGAMISFSQRSLAQKDAAEILLQIPDRHLLLETDFPYLPGKNKNEVDAEDYSEAIDQVYTKTAEIRHVSVEKLNELVMENAKQVLKYM